MHICLVYCDGVKETVGLRQYFDSVDSIEISPKIWLVAHPETAAHLFSELKGHVDLLDRLVVVPLEPHLVPLLSQNDSPLQTWLKRKQGELRG